MHHDKPFAKRLKETWKRFRANLRKSLKGPLITKPHLEMSDQEARRDVPPPPEES